MEIPSNAEEKPISDQVGGDKITGGDIAGSVAAIGAGASVIYNKVQGELDKIDFQEKSQKYEIERLAQALKDYVQLLERQSIKAKADTGYGNPYKALLEFDIQDAALFYGRTIAIRVLLEHINRDQWTVLHAGSGLGKTSLLKAGIMPRILADGNLPLYLRPYQTPVHLALKKALLIDLEDTPHLASLSMHDFLRRVTNLMGDRQLIVIIDQFEELFTVQKELSRSEFIDQLSTCLDDDLLPVRWIIGLRDEWFGQLGTFRPHIRNPYANEFLLHPLSRAEATLVITQPAARCQVSYEPALIERLLDDMGRDEIAPPHLQLVCSMLFDSLNGEGGITEAMYEEAGEAKGILRGYLYRVLSRDMPQEMRIPAQLLLEALVTSEKRRAMRTREDLTTELSAWGYTPPMVDQLLNQLTDSRLLRVEEFKLDKLHSIAAYELAHDYLLEEIDITPEVQSRKAAQELLTQKLPFYKREKLLLSTHELSIILPQRKWLTLSDDARALLRESQAVATRQRRMRLVGIAAATLFILLAMAAFAIQRNTYANSNEKIANTAIAAESLAEQEEHAAEFSKATAESEAIISQAGELAAESQLDKNLGQLIYAYQLAAQSYKTADTFDGRNALYYALSSPLPKSVFTDPSDVVYSANFSPNGDRLVTADYDNLARVWDVASGQVLFTLKGHTLPVTFADYSEDGKYIVTASNDGSAGIWDAETGKNIRIIPAHTGSVFSAQFNSNGKKIVTAGQDNTAAVWDVNTGKLLVRLEGHERPVRFASFSPDGNQIVTASADSTARIWDAITGREIRTLVGHTARVRFAAFNSDGTRILTTSDDRTARVWDAKTGDTLRFLVPHNASVMSANFSPDDKFIVTASQDSLVRLWDANDGTLIASYPGHNDVVNWATFSPDGKWMVSAGNDSTIWLREALRISGTKSFLAHSNTVTSVDVSPDGTQIVTSSPDRTAKIWDIESGKLLFTLEGHKAGVHYAFFSPDGTRIATASADKTVGVWNPTDGTLLYQIPINVDVSSVKFSPDGRQLVTAGVQDRLVRVWDAKTGNQILPPLVGHQDGVNFAVFSPDGARIASVGGTNDGTVRIWDAKSHELLKTFQIVKGDEVNMVDFSPDGRRLVVAADPLIVQVWDIEQEKVVFPLKGHQSDVTSAIYSPDGRLIVTGSEDHTLRLWDAMTGRVLAVMQGHISRVNWEAFSPDGKWIYSASDDRTVRTWPVDFSELDNLVTRELSNLGNK